MIKIPFDVNLDFSKVKVMQINDKYILYQIDNIVLKLYINPDKHEKQELEK